MAKKKKLITAKDLYKFELVSQVRISPDGQQVIYTVQRVDKKTEKKYTNLWVVPTTGGEPRQFTYGDHIDTMPRWSPDGEKIAFLSNRGDKEKPKQLYLIPFCGGEAHSICKIEGSIDQLSWSPSGEMIYCEVRKTDKDVLERQKDEEKKKLGLVDRHYDSASYKLDGFGYLPREHWHIWSVNVETGKTKQLTKHEVSDERNLAVSPDGEWLAYISNTSEKPDLDRDRMDLFLVPAKGGNPVKIQTPAGKKESPSFSPDGKTLAYLGTEGEKISYKNTSLWTVQLDVNSPASNLTEEYDIHVSASTINDCGAQEMVPAIWTKDGGRLYFTIDKHGSTFLCSVKNDGSDLQTHTEEERVVGSISFDAAQEKMVYFAAAIDNSGQVFVRDVGSEVDTCLTNLNAWQAKKDLGEVEEIWYKGPDGNDLQGWILKPPGFDTDKKYPSILEIHGGPMVQYGFYFMHEFYYLAAKGYVVYFTNPRGGKGYGEKHTRDFIDGWGDCDYQDLMAWTDLVSEKPYIDKERMGVTGGSYGGYMTVWIIGHTLRFGAAVAQRVVSNWVSMWGSSDMNVVFENWISPGKMPFQDLEGYWKRSPISYIGAAKTPTLVIHSENDMRCPIEQGEQVFVALKRLGVDTEMVRFPGEPHGLSRVGRTDKRIARLKHISRWFGKYLEA